MKKRIITQTVPKEKLPLWRRLKKKIRTHKATFWTYLFLQLITLLIIAVSIFKASWGTVFFGLFALFLFLSLFFIEEIFQIELPATLEIIILLFIFCSQVLGEAASFYLHFPLWDSVLHTLNGFVCTGIGFALIDILNRRRKKERLSPLFLTLVAFCFSMTVGVLWEFFEFFMDVVFKTDMQKDFILDAVHSVILNEGHGIVSIKNIARTLLYDGTGEVLYVIDGGFLDIGLIDTMKDLILNFIGALIFSFFGYFYTLNRGEGKFAKQFIPTVTNTKEESPKKTEKTESS